ncbi:DUF1398 family protein [Azospirillum doebereinerae]
MDAHQESIARRCLEGAEANTMTFPQIVRTLMAAGFEGYMADLRRATITYHLMDGDGIALPAAKMADGIAPRFDAAAVQGAIKEAQSLVIGYTYKGFCAKVMAAGCAGYIVSFSGARAVYFGRTAETHVEHFPSAA